MACLTHPSYSAAVARDAAPAPDAEAGADATTAASAPENNELLGALGNSLLGLFASEELAVRYPNLPSSALQSAVTAFVGPNALSAVARELGLSVAAPTRKTPAPTNAPTAIPIRWKRTNRYSQQKEIAEDAEEAARADAVRRKDNFQEGLASVVRAFVGLVYQEQVS